MRPSFRYIGPVGGRRSTTTYEDSKYHSRWWAMRVDRQEIEESIKQENRPIVAKILGRFMLNPAEYYAEVERIFDQHTEVAVSTEAGRQVEITDCGVCITPMHLSYLYCTTKLLSPSKGYIAHVPPSGGRGYRLYNSRGRIGEVPE